MNRNEFERRMREAKSPANKNHAYWRGYQRGLRRQFHGENFGTQEEHKTLMVYESCPGGITEQDSYARGYRASFRDTIMAGKRPIDIDEMMGPNDTPLANCFPRLDGTL